MIAEDRLHRLVGGFEADPVAVPIDLLEGRLAVLVAHGHDLPVSGLFLLLDHHEIAVGDVLLDHRIAADHEGELVVGVGPVVERQLVILLDRLDRLTGRDPADELQSLGAAGHRRIFQQLDRARHIRLAMDQPLLLQGLEVAHHAIGAFDMKMRADLPDGRPVAPPLDLAPDERVDFSLSRRQVIGLGHDICSRFGSLRVEPPAIFVHARMNIT